MKLTRDCEIKSRSCVKIMCNYEIKKKSQLSDINSQLWGKKVTITRFLKKNVFHNSEKAPELGEITHFLRDKERHDLVILTRNCEIKKSRLRENDLQLWDWKKSQLRVTNS